MTMTQIAQWWISMARDAPTPEARENCIRIAIKTLMVASHE